MSAQVSRSSQSAVVHATAAVEVAAIAVGFVNDSIHPVIDSLVELAECNSPDDGEIRRRLSLVLNLAKVGRYLVEDAGGRLEMEQGALQAKLNALKAGAA